MPHDMAAAIKDLNERRCLPELPKIHFPSMLNIPNVPIIDLSSDNIMFSPDKTIFIVMPRIQRVDANTG